MRHGFALGVLGFIASLGLAQERPQTGIPLAERIMVADVIVVGKVTDIDKDTKQAAQFPGSGPVNFKIAALKVDEAILGAKGATVLRAGFVAPATAAGGAAQTQLRRLGFDPKLDVGQEGCFFLAKHHKLDNPVIPMSCPPLDPKSESYAKDLAFVRKAVQLLAEPMTSLKSTDAEDRLLTAALLAQRYSMVKVVKGGTTKLEAIPDEESKLILSVMYDAAWNKYEGQFQDPLSIFRRLRLGQDGPIPILTADKARAWLEQNKDTYRIKKRVEADQD